MQLFAQFREPGAGGGEFSGGVLHQMVDLAEQAIGPLPPSSSGASWISKASWACSNCAARASRSARAAASCCCSLELSSLSFRTVFSWAMEVSSIKLTTSPRWKPPIEVLKLAVDMIIPPHSTEIEVFFTVYHTICYNTISTGKLAVQGILLAGNAGLRHPVGV